MDSDKLYLNPFLSVISSVTLNKLLNFPESQFCQLYNEGMGSHLRLVIYSSQSDIHTPAHCSARPSFLCTTARTHPGATWQTLGLGSNISRQVFPTSTHMPHIIFAWEIPWTEEPGGLLQSIGSRRVRHYWSDLAHTQEIVSITPKTLEISGISHSGVLLQFIYQVTQKLKFWVRHKIKEVSATGPGVSARGPGYCIAVCSDPWVLRWWCWLKPCTTRHRWITMQAIRISLLKRQLLACYLSLVETEDLTMDHQATMQQWSVHHELGVSDPRSHKTGHS